MPEIPSSPPKVNGPPDRPTLLWDGDCGFCRRSARWLAGWTGNAVAYEPYQSQLNRFPEIPAAALARAVHLIETDGTIYHSAEAVFAALVYAPGKAKWHQRYRNSVPFATLSEWAYRRVANNRYLLSKVVKLVLGPPPP